MSPLPSPYWVDVTLGSFHTSEPVLAATPSMSKMVPVGAALKTASAYSTPATPGSVRAAELMLTWGPWGSAVLPHAVSASAAKVMLRMCPVMRAIGAASGVCEGMGV